MRTIFFSHFSLLPKNPIFSKSLSIETLMAPATASAAKLLAEYAKSNKSTCKRCDSRIAAGSLRLGLSTKDPRRGFDHVKWHHLDCFPSESRPLSAENEIDGFSSLKSADQDALRNLEVAADMDENTKVEDGGDDGYRECEEKAVKGSEQDAASSVEVTAVKDESSIKDPKRKSTGIEESEKSAKKAKAEDGVVAEYAKSNRSSCKSCEKPIAAGSLRLGLSSRDPRRGFDHLKWHHVNCFPAQSHPLITDKIKGFSSLKESDQDVLRNLEVVATTDESAMQDMKKKITESEESKKSAKNAKVEDGGDDGSRECEEDSVLVKTSGAGELDFLFSADHVKVIYKECTLAPNWKSFQTVIFLEADEGLRASEKIAAFDFDGCLANTNVKRSGPDAWSLMYPSIPEKLQELYQSGYKLVVFTNESNIERWTKQRQKAIDSKIGRLNGFLKLVKLPMQVFIACGLGKSKDQIDDPFRKPKPGMWKLMAENFNSGIEIDMNQSFYVGDAAGRANDHSDADIKFAQAIGLKFHLPETFFAA